jgi:hypothetical protein
MSAEDWLRAAKAEEQRLLDEIVKTHLYKQLEAVRNVIAVYPSTEISTATGVSTWANGPASERSFKMAKVSNEADAAGAASTRARPQ